MNEEREDFIKRLNKFFKWDYSKGEINDREQIKEQLIEELKELWGVKNETSFN